MGGHATIHGASSTETRIGGGIKWVPVEVSYGAAHISNLPGGTTRIREEIGLDGTAKTFDWSATPIKAVSIRVVNDTAGTAELEGSVAICIDPPSTAVRDAWLTAGDSLSADSNRILLQGNSVTELVFTSPIDYIGIKVDDGTETHRVTMVGVEA